MTMSLRKNLKTPRTLLMRDAFESSVSSDFIQKVHIWTNEFISIPNQSDEMEELNALFAFMNQFPDHEIDLSYFEWCYSVGIICVSNNENEISEKGQVYLNLLKENQLVSV